MPFFVKFSGLKFPTFDFQFFPLDWLAMESSFFDEFAACGRITVRVIPNARTSQIAGKMADGRWKIRLRAPAHSGQANRALLQLMEARGGIKAQIISGQHQREKVLGRESGSWQQPILVRSTS